MAHLIEELASDTPQASSIAPFAAASRAAAAELDTLESITRTKFSIIGMPATRENDISALSEYLAEAYLRLAESTRHEQLLITAQKLATFAIDRLGRIKALKMT